MLLLKFISLFLVIALTNCSSNNQSQIYKKINKSFYGGIYKVGDPYLIDEKILTIYLNSQEVLTALTICDYPEYLAVGFLYNQNIVSSKAEIKA